MESDINVDPLVVDSRPVVTPSLKKNATAQFIGSSAVVVAGFISLIITARWLGPAGKGTLSTMLYIVSVSSLAASLGAGDAAIVLAAGNRKKLQKLISASLPLVTIASVPAVGILVVAASIAQWSGIMGTVAVATLLIPIRMASLTLTNFQNALERLVRSSLIAIVQASLEVVVLVLLVVVLGASLTGAIWAAVLGSSAAIILSTRGLARDGLSLVPHWLVPEVRQILRLGTPLNTSWIVIALALRFDLVIVYTITGEAPAGIYAVALSLGQLANYTSTALADAGFPRLARLQALEGWDLVPRLARMSLTSALMSALILLPIVPLMVPWLFGQPYEDAVVPTLILVFAAVAWSELNILTKSAAALGHPLVQLSSFSGYLTVMIILDVLLIPKWGITGAAVASAVAAITALIGFFTWYRSVPTSDSWTNFVPRRADVHELVVFIRVIGRRAFDVLRHPSRAWNA